MIVNSHDDVDRFLADHPDVQRADLLITDTNGLLRGKRVDIAALGKLYKNGLCLPGSVFALDISGETVETTGLGFDQGDMDQVCHPVPGTLSVVPWSEVASAQVLMSMHTADGRPFFADPRHVLAGVAARLGAMGLTPVVAIELEFYLLDARRTPDGGPQPPVSPATGQRERRTQVYSMDDLDAYEAFLRGVADSAALQGIPADTAVAEYAPGQFEINLRHRADALAACDDAVRLKRVIRAEARRHGMDATFMAKPYADQAGNGLHVHLSLVDGNGDNVFASDAPGGNRALRRVVAGMADLMADAMAIFAPTANAYRRFQAGSFAPTSPAWGINNRTTALRVPAGPAEARRVEHRVAGADANPYLVLAAVLAGAHHGLANDLEPDAPCSGNAYDEYPPTLPADWGEAQARLAGSQHLADYLTSDFIALHGALTAADRQRFDAVVTPLEYEWYLDVV